MINRKSESETSPAARRDEDEVAYSYESAGISERKGEVPLWLWSVVAALLIWGMYYLIAYWSAPVAPS